MMKWNNKNEKESGRLVADRRFRKTGSVCLLLILCLVTLLFSGCGGSESSVGGTAQAADVKMVTFTDDCGREVQVPEQISTIVASGSLAEIFLYAISPEKLMAVSTDWSADALEFIPKEYQDLPEVGSFFGNHDLNYEEIAKLSPQIIIDVGEAKPDMKSNLEDITAKTGIPAVHIDAYIDNIDQAFEKLGTLLAMPDEAAKLADFTRHIYELKDNTMKKVKEKTSVLYCTQEDGQNVLALDSYHSQAVDELGNNLAVLNDPSSQGSGNEVNLEQMMNWNPEVILFAPGSYFDYAAEDPAWQVLSAIQNGRFYEVPTGPFNWMGSPPSSNRLLGLLWMAKLLYPKQADYDLKKEVQEYYQLFYHCELNDEAYESLVANSIGKIQE